MYYNKNKTNIYLSNTTTYLTESQPYVAIYGSAIIRLCIDIKTVKFYNCN
jgi:hypothetical protein